MDIPIKTRLKQIIGLAFLGNPLPAWCEPVTRFLLPVAYTFKYARWYRDHHVKQYLIPTEQEFGRHNRYHLYEHIADFYGLHDSEITYLEFGVATGSAIRWWLKGNRNTSSRFHGFDTFRGLPEQWGDISKGTFSTGGITPDVNDNRCSFEVGLFQETLPGFLKTFERAEERLIIHIDCDLYSATLYALIHLAPILKTGDLLIFDEFADVMHEFRAFLDFTSATGINTNIIGGANAGHKMAMLIA